MANKFRVGQAVWYTPLNSRKSVAATVLEIDSKKGLVVYVVEVCGEVVWGYEGQLFPRPVR